MRGCAAAVGSVADACGFSGTNAVAISFCDMQAIQDLYPDDFAHCFGCGRNNPDGHQLKSYVEGERVEARFTPHAHHIAVPGFVYGGLLASLADCHAMATAAAAEMAARQNDDDGA